MSPNKLNATLGYTITDQQSIEEEFNNNFVNIEKSMADSIVSDKPSNKIKSNTSSSPQEVLDLIKKSKNKKSEKNLRY